MPHVPMQHAEAEQKLRAYTAAYLDAYQRTLEQHYADALHEVQGMGRASEFFPLHGRTLGTNLALTALTTPCDFFLFFLDVPDATATRWQYSWPSEGFSQAWTMQSPNAKALDHVRKHLQLAREQEIHIVRIPGTDFMSTEIEHMGGQADHPGSGAGNQDGAKAEALLPHLRESWQEDQSYASLRQRYQDLQNWSGTAQARGRQFEILWRDALALYGWHPKKTRIQGKDNDFTALYNGIHILGEVRWFTDPMASGKMREFLGKLDPRPRPSACSSPTAATTTGPAASYAGQSTPKPSSCSANPKSTTYS